ncbi:MAG: sugar ABC transporter permease [Erysipelotrichaceae bacterium]|jgi:multiple sugar transport system permease protein|nr:sugar ABC transporter permease [Erysipelotrichaceae bacterium]
MLEHKKDGLKAFLLLLVPLILLAIFTFFPLVKTIIIAFMPQYNANLDQFQMSFDGGFHIFDSFVYLFRPGSDFMSALVNTLIIVFISVPASTIIALLIAVLLNSIKPLQKVFQTIFFLPYVTNVLALGMVFSVLFQWPGTTNYGQNGIINTIFGLGNYNWLDAGADEWAWRSVVLIYTIWNGLAFKILVFIGGLQSISKQYYDAAKIDSASQARVLTKVTIPLLSPMISYILITSFIGAFKSYEQILGLFGDMNTTNPTAFAQRNTLVGFTYSMVENPYDFSRFTEGRPQMYSLGAAAAVLLFIIILCFTLFNNYLSRKRVHY